MDACQIFSNMKQGIIVFVNMLNSQSQVILCLGTYPFAQLLNAPTKPNHPNTANRHARQTVLVNLLYMASFSAVSLWNWKTGSLAEWLTVRSDDLSWHWSESRISSLGFFSYRSLVLLASRVVAPQGMEIGPLCQLTLWDRLPIS